VAPSWRGAQLKVRYIRLEPHTQLIYETKVDDKVRDYNTGTKRWKAYVDKKSEVGEDGTELHIYNANSKRKIVERLKRVFR
jgi:hypothetical protein